MKGSGKLPDFGNVPMDGGDLKPVEIGASVTDERSRNKPRSLKQESLQISTEEDSAFMRG